MGVTLVYTDVAQFSGDCRRAEAESQGLVGRALRRSAEVLRDRSNKHINHWSHELERSADITVRVGRSGGEAEVVWTAAHAAVHHDGRGPITARPGRMLRFRLRSGEILFRPRVGPAAPNPFTERGANDAEGEVADIFEGVADEWATLLGNR